MFNIPLFLIFKVVAINAVTIFVIVCNNPSNRPLVFRPNHFSGIVYDNLKCGEYCAADIPNVQVDYPVWKAV